jgi:predicted kinase
MKYQRPTLILFCGLPGSGKTTLARQLEHELPAVRLCPDDWKSDLGIDFFDEATSTLLEVRLWRLALELISRGQNVIVENGLWPQAERSEKLADTEGLDVDVELHYFDVPFEELLRRIEIRNVTAGYGTVPLTRAHMESYREFFEAPDASELARFTRAVIHRPEQ